MKRFNAEDIKKYKEESDKGYVFEIDAECPKILQRQIVLYHLCQKK